MAARACSPSLLMMGSRFSMRGILFLQGPVTNLHRLVTRPETGRQLFRDKHGSVLPSGTADGDRDITAIVALQMGEPIAEQGIDLLAVEHDVRLSLQIITNRAVQPGQRTKFRNPMRIRQEAGIEDEVGILGGAMLEAEGFEDQNQLLLLAAQDPLTDLLAE